MTVERKVCCAGSCHCGKVQFRAMIAEALTVHRCNCSICSMCGYLHVIVSSDELEVIKGWDDLQEYQFNTRQARHLFCRTCGIKPFYVPRSHPQGYSINLACLELEDRVTVLIEDFDGKNWARNVDKIT